jgi:hypothetical protein
MSYLGNEPPQIAGYSAQTKAAPVGSSITLNQEGNVNSTLLFLDGVRQTPTTDYTISGTTLTLTSTAPTSAVATILFLGDVADIGVPSDDAVNVAQLDTTSAGTTGQYLRKTGASSIDWEDAATDTSGIEDDIALLGFKVASNGSWSKYNLVDQTEDSFVDATGIDAGDSTAATWNAAKYFSGTSSGSITATGGTITTDGDYTIHSFNNASSPKTFTTDTAQDVEILLIAGGGAGSNDYGGGGGAGGVIVHPSFAVSAAAHSIVIGTGGSATTSIPGPSGTNSTFSTLTAVGGGGGGGWSPTDGVNGGSGGGGARAASAGNGGSGTQTSPTGGTGYGNDGGNGNQTGRAGGGGGAGAAAVDGGGEGADGIQSDIYETGTNVYYAAGGGGGAPPGISGGAGGSGGGGQGGTGNTNQAGTAATADTGSGGGGGAGGGGALGGAGANGLFVLRRPTSETAIANMTLVSEFTEAEDTPTKGDIVMTYTNGVAGAGGVTAINTDLKAYASRDDGTTWTQLTLAAQGSTGTSSPHFIVSAHDVDISSQPDDKTMRYKIETLNQTSAKETRIQAVSLGWS